MDLRYEIEQLIELSAKGEKYWEWEGTYETAASSFLRDHGPALLEAVKDQERYDWVYRTCVLVTKGRGMFVEFPIPYNSASLELSAAIDAARGDA